MRDHDEPASPIEAVEPLLIAEVRSYRRSWTVGAVSLALVLATIVAIGAAVLPREQALGAAALALLGAPVILVLLILGFRDPSRHPALRALRARSGSVVWVFTRLYHGSLRLDELVLGFEDGSMEALPVDPARSRDLLAQVAGALPQATIGFSPEAADTFHRSPAELRRSSPQRIGPPDEVREAGWLLPSRIAGGPAPGSSHREWWRQ